MLISIRKRAAMGCPRFSMYGPIAFSLSRRIEASRRIFMSGAKTWLPNSGSNRLCSSAAEALAGRELNRIGKLVEEYHERLIESWHEFFGR